MLDLLRYRYHWSWVNDLPLRLQRRCWSCPSWMSQALVDWGMRTLNNRYLRHLFHYISSFVKQSANNPSALICKVCQTPYQVETKARSWSQINVAITPWHWAQTAGLVLLMCGSVGGACAIIKFYEDSGIRLLAVSVALLIVYICCR
jgi:hypothetical protein